jgi:GT2 family glycosyltransferase
MQHDKEKDPSISIVMTHFNRAHLLERTLHTFTYNKTRDFEIVIVDDASETDEWEKLINLISEYEQHFKFKLFRTKETSKWYSNPCVPFNIGLKKAKGKIIIIQNPECLHVGNIIDYVHNRLDKFDADETIPHRKFMTFACYNIDKNQTESLAPNPTPGEILKTINPVNNNPITHCEEPGWYDHSKYRPLAYHWCNAIANEDFKKLKYFDERYAFGTAYDDDELAWRVKKLLYPYNEGIDNPLVIHQWHGLGNYYKNPNQAENQMKQDYNHKFFESITKSEQRGKYNPDNIRNDLSEKVDYDSYEH